MRLKPKQKLDSFASVMCDIAWLKNNFPGGAAAVKALKKENEELKAKLHELGTTRKDTRRLNPRTR